MSWLRLLPILLLGIGGASCGVDYDPADFCFRCAEDTDCGDGFVCEAGGKVAYCIPEDPAEAAKSPCNPD